MEPPPGVLHHYTSWPAAEGILKGKAFWATAHDCTNDPAELKTADDTILRVATRLKEELQGECAALIQLLLDGHSKFNVRSVASNYLACFSAARDKVNQWTAYAEDGSGVCLSIPVLSEAPPRDGIGRSLVRVRYSEAEVEEVLDRSFRKVCASLQGALKLGAPRDNDTAKPALSALYRIAGIAALAAKEPGWSTEEEWRMVAIVKPSLDAPLRRHRPDGQEVRYIELTLRADDLPLAVSEVMIGPNQDRSEGYDRAKQLLADCGYALTGDAATKITVSGPTDP